MQRSFWSRFWYRLKQFWFALTSQMSEEDKSFARQYLNIAEASLFFSLPEFEQKHGVVVAQKMQKAAHGKLNLEERKLIRLGLLHDIGKAAVRLSIFDKSLLVILHRALSPLYNYLAKLGEPDKSFSLFRKFYVHKHHGEVGAKLLAKISEPADIISEVKSHDKPVSTHDVYMKLLDDADSTY